MITRDIIRELAGFRCENGAAVSFFYQPHTPQNKSHRGEAIAVKDLVRNALREHAQDGANSSLRADLERILDVAERLHGNHARAKAIFACAAQNFWQEFDLPPKLPQTRLFLNQRFHVKPLTALADSLARTGVVVLDRSQARFFQVWLDEIQELEKINNDLPRRGRSDGWAGYDAGHAERHVDHEAMQFFKRMANRLQDLYEGGAEKFIIGCRDETWPEVEPHLHPYVRQRLVARFPSDPATVTEDEVRKHAERLLDEDSSARRQRLLQEVAGEANRNGRGAVGLKRVLLALETGEAQILLLSETFSAPGTRCTNCGHVDGSMANTCAVCNRPVEELDDISDVIITQAIERGVETVCMQGEPELSRYEGIAALLRFRADQNTEVKKAG